ncbi:unnamed protein product [Brachionus calyciflorus]|uniref:Uncharacterized protein n=1 Tax=Brachionus calyciflorus TaxID=104777 RepID=A0A814KDB3_9BILA|nr:unnamed protein product [Brachionus calyciflorus]
MEKKLEFLNAEKSSKIISFNFGDEYRRSLMKLQTKLDSKDVAEFSVKESTAKSTCYAIRRSRRNQPEPKNTKNLNLDETEKFIKINGNKTFNKNLKRILSDFELSLMISINTVYKDVQIKAKYVHDWDFRFWVRRFLILPLIIIKSIPSNDQNALKFEGYFEKLAYQMMNPYESMLDDMKIEEGESFEQIEEIEISSRKTFKKEKLINNFKSEDFENLLKLENTKNITSSLSVSTDTETIQVATTSTAISKSVIKRKNENGNHGEKSSKMQKVGVDDIILIDENPKFRSLENSDTVLFLSDSQWLSISHIDFGLDSIERLYSQPDDNSRIDPKFDQIFIIKQNHWILMTNIDPLEEQEVNDNQDLINRKWFMYDSQNKRENPSALKPILKLLYPDDLTHVVIMVEVVPQKVIHDCGLFVLAYAHDLAQRKDPYNLKYDQRFMRQNFNVATKICFLNDFKSKFVKNLPKKVQTIII